MATAYQCRTLNCTFADYYMNVSQFEIIKELLLISEIKHTHIKFNNYKGFYQVINTSWDFFFDTRYQFVTTVTITVKIFENWQLCGMSLVSIAHLLCVNMCIVCFSKTKISVFRLS